MRTFTIVYRSKHTFETVEIEAENVVVEHEGSTVGLRYTNPRPGQKLPRIVSSQGFEVHVSSEGEGQDDTLKKIRRALAGLPDSTTLAATIRQIVDEVPAMTEADMDKSTLDSIWLLQQGDPSGNDFDEKVRDLIARRNLFNQRSDEVRAAMACEIRREQKVSP